MFQYPTKQLHDGQQEIVVLADVREDGSRVQEAVVVLPQSADGHYRLV